MAISEITEKLLAAKKTKGISLAELEKVVGRDEVWIAAVIYRQAAASQEEAEKILSALGLDISSSAALTEPPLKGGLDPAVPVDPLIYRFYEIVQNKPQFRFRKILRQSPPSGTNCIESHGQTWVNILYFDF
jgi:cyanate lyase